MERTAIIRTRRAAHAALGCAALLLLACENTTGPEPEIKPEEIKPEAFVTVLMAVGGNDQSAGTGTTLLQPLRVRALNKFGNPVPGAAVTFVAVEGGGSIAADRVFTDSSGHAISDVWTLGPVAGEQRVRAQAGDTELIFKAQACEPAACGRLAYSSGGSIFTLDVHTQLIHRLTSGGNDQHPAWSPDGGRIAFTRFRSDGVYPDVWVMNADGTGQTRVTNGNPFHSPSWSPDGDALVISDGSACYYECAIYVQQLAAGSAPRLIAEMGTEPSWSPDGSRIAYVGLGGDDGYDILRVVQADGSAIFDMTTVGPGFVDGPAWSPDGTLIAFADGNIHTVRPDGSDLKPLTAVNIGIPVSAPAWSADGTRIAFTLWTDDGASIMWIPAEGGAMTTLIPSGRSPAWRP